MSIANQTESRPQEYPHRGGCECCRSRKLCNFCGRPLDQGHCTNGRCSACHARVCITIGPTVHGYGPKETP